MIKYILLLTLLLFCAAAWAQGQPAVPIEPASLLGNSGNLTFPGALVVSAWLIARWRPEFRLHVDFGEKAGTTLERIAVTVADRLSATIERICEAKHG